MLRSDEDEHANQEEVRHRNRHHCVDRAVSIENRVAERGAVKRVGIVTDQIADNSSGSAEVATAGAGQAFGIRLIVVGLDGSIESQYAADHAVVLAEMFGAEVVALHATGLLDVWPTTDEVPQQRNSHARVRELMESTWSESLRHSRARWRLELRDGPPADTLLNFAVELDADLIVIGTRGSGNFPAGALGSTSAKVVERSHIPVLVVPSPSSVSR